MTAFLDPLAYIRHFESAGRYNIAYGGTDISGAQHDEFGFPLWEGKDNSHAAGAYQFQPGTWRQYASRLGIKDFSEESQDAVAVACFAARGFADWAPYDAPLAAAIKAAGGEGAFSLGATWLGMNSPIPEPPPQSETIYLDIVAHNQRGELVTTAIGARPLFQAAANLAQSAGGVIAGSRVALLIGGLIGGAMLAAAMAPGHPSAESRPGMAVAQQTEASAPIPPPPALPLPQSSGGWRGAGYGETWRFDSPDGIRLTTSCRHPSGTWLPCP